MSRCVPLQAGLLAACVSMLAACGGRPADEPPPKAEAPAAAKRKTVFDDQLKALDKAKALEKQMQEDQRKRDEEIEKQEQGG